MNKIVRENYGYIMLGMYILIASLLPKANSTAWLLFIVVPSLINIKKYGYKKTGFEIPLFLFTLVVFISFIGTPMEYIKIGLKELEKPIKFLSLILFIPQIILSYSAKDKKYLKYIFLLISLIYIILVYLASKGVFLIYNYGDSHMRLTGGYQVSSYSGTLMVINLYYFRDMFFSKKYIEKIIFIITLILLILTNSRGAWLGAFGGYGIYILLEQRKNLLKILIFSILLGIVIWNMKIPSIDKFKNRATSIGNLNTDRSNLGRLYMWKEALPIVQENPINGIGYRTGGRDVVDYFNPRVKGIVHFHNMLIDIFAGAGILGVLAYLYIWFRNIKTVERLKMIMGSEAYSFLYPMIGVLIYDNFEPLWIRGFTYNVLFALLGLMYAYFLILKKGEQK